METGIEKSIKQIYGTKERVLKFFILLMSIGGKAKISYLEKLFKETDGAPNNPNLRRVASEMLNAGFIEVANKQRSHRDGIVYSLTPLGILQANAMFNGRFPSKTEFLNITSEENIQKIMKSLYSIKESDLKLLLAINMFGGSVIRIDIAKAILPKGSDFNSLNFTRVTKSLEQRTLIKSHKSNKNGQKSKQTTLNLSEKGRETIEIFNLN